MSDVTIVPVNNTNVDDLGFFCYKSKPKSPGYRLKLEWLRERFAEGMAIKILYEGERSVGFIEYIPGEYAWRPVHAENYLVIHCLWVVGKAKGKGYGSQLVQSCVKDARKMGKHGVVMPTSSRTWLASPKILLKNGFEVVDQAPPSFDLLVRSFGEAPMPSFPKNWEERLQRHGSGLTVIRSDQCPYVEDGVKATVDAARERGVEARVVEMTSSQQVQETALSAYGVSGVIYNGQLLSYHYLGRKGIGLLDEHLVR
jgi:GNAT superfamily N-acetyltransferase